MIEAWNDNVERTPWHEHSVEVSDDLFGFLRIHMFEKMRTQDVIHGPFWKWQAASAIMQHHMRVVSGLSVPTQAANVFGLENRPKHRKVRCQPEEYAIVKIHVLGKREER